MSQIRISKLLIMLLIAIGINQAVLSFTDSAKANLQDAMKTASRNYRLLFEKIVWLYLAIRSEVSDG